LSANLLRDSNGLQAPPGMMQLMTSSNTSTAIDAPTPRVPWVLRHQYRFVAMPVFFACSGLLGVAAWLSPADKGFGTHQGLGLPPCQFEQATGIPCATCGCTTAFAHAANGSMLDALITQPFGAILAVFTAMTVIVTGYAVAMNMPLGPIARVFGQGKVVAVGLIIMFLAWGYNIAMHWS